MCIIRRLAVPQNRDAKRTTVKTRTRHLGGLKRQAGRSTIRVARPARVTANAYVRMHCMQWHCLHAESHWKGARTFPSGIAHARRRAQQPDARVGAHCSPSSRKLATNSHDLSGQKQPILTNSLHKISLIIEIAVIMKRELQKEKK